MGAFEIIGIYLLTGIVALGLLDLFTGRIRKNIRDASYKSQDKLIARGSYVGMKTAIVLTLIALWIFWVVAIYGAISSWVNKEGKKEDGS